MLIPKIFCILAASLSTAGVLTVETEPGAQVVWEGVVLGVADARGRMEIQDIPLGSYSLTVSKDGFSSLQRKIEVHAGRQSASFRLSFSKGAAERSAPAGSARRGLSEAEQPVTPIALSAVEAAPAAAADPSRAYAQERAVERRSSQIDQRQSAETPMIWYVLVASVMAGVLFRFLRRPAAMVPPRSGPPPTFSASGLPPADAATEPTASSTAFLDDLRRREAMVEKGVLALAAEEDEAAIELDKTSVREVDE